MAINTVMDSNLFNVSAKPCCFGADGFNVVVSQLSEVVCLSLSGMVTGKAFIKVVAHIVLLRTQPQVIRSYAEGVITSMADLLVFLQVAVMNLVRNTMGVKGSTFRLSSAQLEEAIFIRGATAYYGSSPLPAITVWPLSRGLVHLGPKPLDILRGNWRKFTIGSSHNLNHLSGLVKAHVGDAISSVGRFFILPQR